MATPDLSSRPREMSPPKVIRIPSRGQLTINQGFCFCRVSITTPPPTCECAFFGMAKTGKPEENHPSWTVPSPFQPHACLTPRTAHVSRHVAPAGAACRCRAAGVWTWRSAAAGCGRGRTSAGTQRRGKLPRGSIEPSIC